MEVDKCCTLEAKPFCCMKVVCMNRFDLSIYTHRLLLLDSMPVNTGLYIWGSVGISCNIVCCVNNFGPVESDTSYQPAVSKPLTRCVFFQARSGWCGERACHSTETPLRREICTSSLMSSSPTTTGSALRSLWYVYHHLPSGSL